MLNEIIPTNLSHSSQNYLEIGISFVILVISYICHRAILMIRKRLKSSEPEEIDTTLYFNESERFKSFQNYVCQDFVFDDELKRKFARAGLYWTQTKEQIKCVFCHFGLVSLKAGETDPVRLHYRFQSSCSLYNFREPRNIPIDDYLLQTDLLFQPYYRQYATYEERLKTFSSCIRFGYIERLIAKKLASMGFFCCRSGIQMIECHYCRVKCNFTEGLSKIINQHGEQRKWCPFQMSLFDKMFESIIDQDTNGTANNINESKNERIEHEESENNMSRLIILDQIRGIIPDLEKLGFCYTESNSTVTCSSCKAEIDCYKHHVNILGEHARISPRCELSFIKHPKYAIASERINSFATYHQSSSPYPSTLSALGFFYSGNNKITCFSCNFSTYYHGLGNFSVLQPLHKTNNFFKSVKCCFLKKQ